VRDAFAGRQPLSDPVELARFAALYGKPVVWFLA